MEVNYTQQRINKAIRNNQNFDLIKATGGNHDFKYYPQEEFINSNRIVIIGVSSIEKIINLLRTLPEDTEIIILENDSDIVNQVNRKIDSLDTISCSAAIHYCDYTNLRIDYNQLAEFINNNSVNTLEDYCELENWIRKQCKNKPLIDKGWAELVYIDKLYEIDSKKIDKIIMQTYGLLNKYGKILINTILTDDVLRKAPQYIGDHKKLNSLFKEDEFQDILLKHGFHGFTFVWRGEYPIKIVNQVELRMFVLKAYKGKQGICIEKGHAVFYAGPWKEVVDDDGHKLIRGKRMAVCEKTYKLLTSEPFSQVIGIPSYHEIPDGEAQLFDCNTREERDPRITKGIIRVDGSKLVVDGGKSCC